MCVVFSSQACSRSAPMRIPSMHSCGSHHLAFTGGGPCVPVSRRLFALSGKGPVVLALLPPGYVGCWKAATKKAYTAAWLHGLLECVVSQHLVLPCEPACCVALPANTAVGPCQSVGMFAGCQKRIWRYDCCCGQQDLCCQHTLHYSTSSTTLTPAEAVRC